MLEDIHPVCVGRRWTGRAKFLPVFGGLVAGTILTGASAHAQEALFSALSQDSLSSPTNTPAALSPEQPHLGPVQLTLGAYTGVEANDNINTSQFSSQSDVILHAGLNLGFIWPATEQSELDFYTSAGYGKYLEHPSNDRFEVDPGSALSWNISFEDGTLTFFDQFSDSQSVISEASVTGLSKLPRIDNTAGTRADWQPGRWLFELGYSHDTYFSDDATYEYLNRNSEYFFLRAGHLLAEDTQLGLEASASLTRYQIPIQSNNTSYSLGPYFNWQITDHLNASARGGYTIYVFDANGANQPAQNLDSYYASLTLTHQLTEFVSQKLSIERDISLGLGEGNNYTEQLTVNYGVSWAATTHLGLSLNLNYADGSQPLTTQTYVPFYGFVSYIENENYSRVGINPGISYQFTEKLSGSLIYGYWTRTSNLFGNSYQDNDLTLQLNYSF